MQLSIFKYQSPKEQQLSEIMTVEIDGEIWFAAVDVCNVLGLTNPTDSLRALDDTIKKI